MKMNKLCLDIAILLAFLLVNVWASSAGPTILKHLNDLKYDWKAADTNEKIKNTINNSKTSIEAKVVIPLILTLPPLELSSEQVQQLFNVNNESKISFNSLIINKIKKDMFKKVKLDNNKASTDNYSKFYDLLTRKMKEFVKNDKENLEQFGSLNSDDLVDINNTIENSVDSLILSEKRSPRKKRRVEKNKRWKSQKLSDTSFAMSSNLEFEQRRLYLPRSNLHKEGRNVMNIRNKVSNIILDTYNNRHQKPYKKTPVNHFLDNNDQFKAVVQGMQTNPKRRPFNFGVDRPMTYNSENNNEYYKPNLPNSFDDLSLVTGTATLLTPTLDIERRLGKLDSVFNSLHLKTEECRKRVMCEITREDERFAPLADILKRETKVIGSMQNFGRELLETPEGTRLLTYIEATVRGRDRYRQCDVYRYRCHQDVSQIIDMDALLVWREVVGWLTIKVLSKER